MIDHRLEFCFVSLHILNRSAGDARVGCGLRNGWSDLHDQSRIKRLGNDVVWSKSQVLTRVGLGDFVALLSFCEFGNRLNASKLHGFGNAACPSIQGATENKWETEDVVDLIRVVGAARGNNAIWTRCFGDFGTYFRLRIRKRQNQGRRTHTVDHFCIHHTGRRATQEYVGSHHGISKRTKCCILCIAFFIFFHLCIATLINHTTRVTHKNVFFFNTEMDK